MNASTKPLQARRGRPRLGDRLADMRAAAISAARKLCLVEDEGGFTMERVAQLLGVRTPSLYHHFPGGREELIVAVADECSLRDGAAVAAITAIPGDPLERLHDVARQLASSINGHPYRRLTELRRTVSPAARIEMQRGFEARVEGPLVALLAAGIREGRFRPVDPELFVRIFLMLILNLTDFEAEDCMRARLPALVVDTIAGGLLKPQKA